MRLLRLQRPVRYSGRRNQRGAVLVVAMIALVIIMLAAVSLVRSVDTNTLIAGNLAFKQSATAAGDAGLEKAMTWMAGVQNANMGIDAFTDITHPFNKTVAANGYYSSVSTDPSFLTADSTWANGKSVELASKDAGGNSIRYIIERMCRTADQLLSEVNCLFSDAESDDSSHDSNKPQAIKGGKHPMNRITVRVTGPRNTVSYVQAFVY